MNKYQIGGLVLVPAIGLGVWQGWGKGVAFIAVWVALEVFERFATKAQTK